MQNAGWIWLVLLAVPMAGATQGHGGHADHGDKAGREIKALSDEEKDALFGGAGMGYALAAKSNGYPGPRHVLDLEEALYLRRGQLEAISRIFEGMNERARELGSRLVEGERELDERFGSRSATDQAARELVSAMDELETELRYVHLEAPLRTTALLSHDQIERYDMERGYGHYSDVHGRH